MSSSIDDKTDVICRPVLPKYSSEDVNPTFLLCLEIFRLSEMHDMSKHLHVNNEFDDLTSIVQSIN